MRPFVPHAFGGFAGVCSRSPLPGRRAFPNLTPGPSARRSGLWAWFCLGLFLLEIGGEASELSRVSFTPDQVILEGVATGPLPARLFEAPPFPTSPGSFHVLTNLASEGSFRVVLPRVGGSRDRVYSRFGFLTPEGLESGPVRFGTGLDGISKYREAFPRTPSKKGLQVQMLDDALALGVRHAALNVNLTGLIDPARSAGNEGWSADGETWFFNKAAVDGLDRQVKTLSDSGVVVSLILLAYQSSDPARNALMLHPRYDPAAPNRLGAFNTTTEQGFRWFSATMEFLAERYSRPDRRHGRAVNFILGNEVNSHWEWANMGRVTLEEFAEDYLRTLRVCHAAVRKFSNEARVYISLEHHWNKAYQPDPLKGFPGRALVDFLNKRAKLGGDFDWHLAFHPYPENLFECRTWNDRTATREEGTPRITFKNLEMLTAYFRRAELLYQGKPRHIILSEQGFHTPDTPEGERLQAAAYCYAYVKVREEAGIDSFILHRHVDHKAEGGLKLGLWRWNETTGGAADPGAKKLIHDVFKAADGPGWEESFRFALPIIGITNWTEILPPGPR